MLLFEHFFVCDSAAPRIRCLTHNTVNWITLRKDFSQTDANAAVNTARNIHLHMTIDEPTCVDEVLVGETGMVHVVDAAGQQGGQLFQGRQHTLNIEMTS